MKKSILVFSVGCLLAYEPLSAPAHILEGKVDNTDYSLNTESPAEDSENSILWDTWRKQIQDEIHRRVAKRIKEMNVHISGWVIIRYVVSRDGQVMTQIIQDNSTNLGLVAPNCIEGLAGEGILKFPEGSQRKKVATQATFKVDDTETDKYFVGDIEYVR